jgi:precorrin-6B C5,15-methyltransferase / cobalt-precorrin-6B C5,C15-methyltransferase
MQNSRAYIIGIPPDGAQALPSPVHRMVKQAEHVFGGERLLEMFDLSHCEKTVIRNNLSEIAALMKANIGHKKTVVLASGDPSFFGIAKYLVGKLGKTSVEVIPNVSAVQIAFARIKENWEDAAMVSVHSRPIAEIVATVRQSHKIAILTDARNTPDRIARALLNAGIEDCPVHICQDLGSKKERIISSDLSKLAGLKFSPLNVMIILRTQTTESGGNSQLFGMPETEFERIAERSLITKHEVRAVSLAKLGLTESSTVWDIGAGSGAVSIEASLLAGKGMIYAVERNRKNLSIIESNIKHFCRHNIKVIGTVAPKGLESLPAPSAIFIGGTGGKMSAILDCACGRLKPGGHIVCNLTTLENVYRAMRKLKTNGFSADITLVNIARSRNIAGLTRLEPLNPVFIVTGSRSIKRIEHK